MNTQTIQFIRPVKESGKQPDKRSATTQRWSVEDVETLFKLPFADLMFRAQQVHRENFDPNAVQLSTLLSIKTGGCSEDCGYCPQSAFHSTGVENRKMLEVEEVVKAARAAQQNGADRFCMGAAWREPSAEDMASVVEMVKAVRGLGMETCATLGMLNDQQTEQLRDAGLDYYNHNLDTSPEFYGDIISTRDYQDRLDTLERVRKAGMNVCSGGIVGMGENLTQRAGLVAQLANLEPYLTCNSDSYRAIHGCTSCSLQSLKRFHGSDKELVRLFKTALDEITEYLAGKTRMEIH
jgi:biotin synthase